MTPPTADWPHGNWATAPYTAIPFPTTPMPALTDPTHIHHDRLDTTLLHGWIALTATTTTPLFCGTDASTTPAAITTGPDTPRWIIPDTTLTGMLRNTLRMITGSRLPAIDPTPLFLRQPLGKANPLRGRYRDQGGMIQPPDRNDHVAIGYLTRTGNQLRVDVVAATPQKASTALVLNQLRRDGLHMPALPNPNTDPGAASGFRPNTHPAQGQPVTYLPAPSVRDKIPALTAGTGPDAVTRLEQRRGQQGKPRKGYVYLTGIAGIPRTATYIWPDTPTLRSLDVPDHIRSWFDTDAQITDYQAETFTGTTPGALDTALATTGRGQPVWIRYTTTTPTTDLNQALSGATLISLGRSGGYRVPAYRPNPLSAQPGPARTTLDGIPPALLHHTQPTTPPRVTPGTRPRTIAALPPEWKPDAIQAMFGDVDLPDPWPSQLARRVSCSTLVADPDATLDPARTVTLLSPHPSCYLHYLTPGDAEDGIVTWSHPEVQLRGYKIYLHRTEAEATHTADPAAATSRTIQPVSPGTRFQGRITFSNLTSQELGLLLVALDLDNGPHGGPGLADPTSCHKLGQGRSIGLGSVHLSYQLHLIDPYSRYRSDPVPHTDQPADPSSHTRAARLLLSSRPGYLAVLKASQWANRLPSSLTGTMPLTHTPAQPGFDQQHPLPLLAQLWPDYTPTTIAGTA